MWCYFCTCLLTDCLRKAFSAVFAELLVMALHHVQTYAADSRLTLQTTNRCAQQVVLDKEAL